MQEIDQKAIEERGIPSILLMENAGRRTSEVCVATLGSAKGKKIAVFCGTGNNGGDGFVAARYLREQGAEVSVNIIGDRSRIKGDPKINLRKLEKTGVNVRDIDSPVSVDADLVIDAIFGIGLKGDVKEPARSIIAELNEKNLDIVSADVPSGLDADTGEVLGEAIKAKKTVTMQFAKNGFYINKGSEYTGEIIVVDIGIPEDICAGS